MDHALVEGGCTYDDIDGVAVTVGPGLVGCAARRRGGRQVAGAGSRPAADRRQPPRGPRLRDAAGVRASAAAAARADRQSAGTPASCCSMPTVRSRPWAPRSTTRPGRRSTRSRASSACPTPAGPRSTPWRRKGDPAAIAFPRALATTARFDFSLSGLKTAVVRELRRREAVGEDIDFADVAASFQEAVVDVAGRQDDGCGRRRTTSARSRSWAAWPPTAACASAWPTPAGRRPAPAGAVARAVHRQRRDDRRRRHGTGCWLGSAAAWTSRRTPTCRWSRSRRSACRVSAVTRDHRPDRSGEVLRLEPRDTPRIARLLESDFGRSSGGPRVRPVAGATRCCWTRWTAASTSAFLVWPGDDPVAVLYISGPLGTLVPAGDPVAGTAVRRAAERAGWRVLVGDAPIIRGAARRLSARAVPPPPARARAAVHAGRPGAAATGRAAPPGFRRATYEDVPVADRLRVRACTSRTRWARRWRASARPAPCARAWPTASRKA